MFHNLTVPVLHLFIRIVKFLSLSVDELNDRLMIDVCVAVFCTAMSQQSCSVDLC